MNADGNYDLDADLGTDTDPDNAGAGATLYSTFVQWPGWSIPLAVRLPEWEELDEHGRTAWDTVAVEVLRPLVKAAADDVGADVLRASLAALLALTSDAWGRYVLERISRGGTYDDHALAVAMDTLDNINRATRTLLCTIEEGS